MFSVNKYSYLCIALSLMTMQCSGITDDLWPSGKDYRYRNSGLAVGDLMPDFSIASIDGSIETKASVLSGGKPAVFYFTMWCSLCNSDTDVIVNSITSAYPNVNYYLVDYVNGNLEVTKTLFNNSGYGGTVLKALVETKAELSGLLNASMATIVVVDATGRIRLSESFRTGDRLKSTLSGL